MIPNLRDIGETINLICGEDVLHEGVIFRGGSVNDLFGKEELPDIRTIINLRKGPDQQFEGVRGIHIPATDTLDNYLTERHKIRSWVNNVLSALIACREWPVLIHCTAGKDRTGVIIAAILKIVGISNEAIKEEYLFSDGVSGANHIEIALRGFGSINEYIYQSEIFDILKHRLLVVKEE